MKAENILATIVIASVIVVGGLFSNFLWKIGLNASPPSSIREWMKICARGDDIYCKSAYKIAKGISYPIIFIYPNKGSKLIFNDIYQIVSEDNTIDIDEVVRSNIFPASSFNSGRTASINGTRSETVCSNELTPNTCKIQNLRTNLLKKFPDGSAVYTSISINSSDTEKDYDFILPKK